MKVLLVIAALCFAGIESLSKDDVQNKVNTAYERCPEQGKQCRSTCILVELKLYDAKRVFKPENAKNVAPDGVDPRDIISCRNEYAQTACETDGQVLDCFLRHTNLTAGA